MHGVVALITGFGYTIVPFSRFPMEAAVNTAQRLGEQIALSKHARCVDRRGMPDCQRSPGIPEHVDDLILALKQRTRDD